MRCVYSSSFARYQFCEDLPSEVTALLNFGTTSMCSCGGGACAASAGFGQCTVPAAPQGRYAISVRVANAAGAVATADFLVKVQEKPMFCSEKCAGSEKFEACAAGAADCACGTCVEARPHVAITFAGSTDAFPAFFHTTGCAVAFDVRGESPLGGGSALRLKGLDLPIDQGTLVFDSDAVSASPATRGFSWELAKGGGASRRQVCFVAEDADRGTKSTEECVTITARRTFAEHS